MIKLSRDIGIDLGTANVLAEAGAKIYALSRTGGLKDPTEYCHENIIHSNFAPLKNPTF